MAEKMEAMVMHGFNDYGIEQVDIPKPAKNEVLVKIKAVSICGSDPSLLKGAFKVWPPRFPFIIGHEWSGEVVELGEGVTAYKVGDRVAGEAHNGCGTCDNCQRGMYNLCLNHGKEETGHRHYGFTSQGAYAEYNAYNVKAIAKIPDNVSYEEASLTDTAGTALQAIRLTGIVPTGYSLIIGPGPIGIFAMQIAKAMGSQTIMIGRKERLEIAKKMGVDYAVNYEQTDDVVAKVKEITGGIGADQVFECAGSDAALQQSVYAAKKNGKVAFVSLPKEDLHMMPTKTMVMNQIWVIGSRANPNTSTEVLKMMSMGMINAKDMITHTFPLKEFDKAADIFMNRKDGALKVVVVPGK